ncbi:single-stranded DNA-binding protein [Nocardioides insulae]|uniref:single-stranded DNA-binding protein n=1 Tax=Nocardioides insulae TaxID=394734 RepID=UPI001FDF349E|nr:single-stranded DNA-binding protein [Nocardioides insulae]
MEFSECGAEAPVLPSGMESHGDLNEVRVSGRVSGEVQMRDLPSGDRVLAFRLVIRRPSGHVSRQSVDVLDCAVWKTGLQRRMTRWSEGDLVEVSGAVRRRFYRRGGAAASRVEIEVAGGRRLSRRAAPG